MKHLSIVGLCMAVVLSGVAEAQPVRGRSGATEAVRPGAAVRRGIRLRFGQGACLGVTGTAEDGRLGYGLLGLYFRVGPQFNDLVGLHLDLAGTTLVLSGSARMALIVDLTFADRFTVGTGVMAGGSYAHFEICRNRFCADAGWDSGLMIGVPLHLSFKSVETLSGSSRRGFGMSLDGDLGRMLDGRTAFGAHLTFGWEWY